MSRRAASIGANAADNNPVPTINTGIPIHGIDSQMPIARNGTERNSAIAGTMIRALMLPLSRRRRDIRPPASKPASAPVPTGSACRWFDHGALMAAEGPDAVAGAEEREVLADHPVEQPAQIGLDPPLDR